MLTKRHYAVRRTECHGVAQTLNTSDLVWYTVHNRAAIRAASINDALGLKVEVVVKHTRHTGHHGAGGTYAGVVDGCSCDVNRRPIFFFLEAPS